MPKQTVVIGGTGFLGQKISTLGRYQTVNSSTARSEFARIKDVGKVEKVIICAPSSKRYLANQAPLTDIKSIIDVCNKVRLLEPEKVLFCSTVDAYNDAQGSKIEQFDNSLDINYYGLHRNLLEHYLKHEFTEVTVIRLGNLFGYNLRKNIIYDLLNSTGPLSIPNDSQQWISADWLAELVVNHPNLLIDGMTLVSEPIRVSEISRIICRNHNNFTFTDANRFYDLKSNHIFSDNEFIYKSDAYTFDKETILQLMKHTYA